MGCGNTLSVLKKLTCTQVLCDNWTEMDNKWFLPWVSAQLSAKLTFVSLPPEQAGYFEYGGVCVPPPFLEYKRSSSCVL